MGEQVQKPEEEKKPEVEEKKEEVEKPAGDEKKPEESKEAPPPPPPPPPQEIVLRVFMHCEGCARKVRRCLRGFEGVEDVMTDCKTHKVVVKGEKADPLKVLERVQKKSHRQVELLSPIPKPTAEEPEPPKEKEAPKPEEKKEEPPQVITVVLQVNMHCEACAQEIRKRILRMKGVESVEPDLKQSQVSVKGTFEAPQLVDYVHKRTGKRALILKQDPEPKKDAAAAAADADKAKEDNKEAGAGEKKEETKPEEGGGGDGKEKEKEGVKEKDKEGGEKKKEDGGGGGEEGGEGGAGGGGGGGGDDMKVVEVRKNEFYYYHPQNYAVYPPRYTAESAYGYPPAPQMFSDENPNACSVM